MSCAEHYFSTKKKLSFQNIIPPYNSYWIFIQSFTVPTINSMKAYKRIINALIHMQMLKRPLITPNSGYQKY